MRFPKGSATAFASWSIVISMYMASAFAQDHDAIAQQLYSSIIENVEEYTNNTNSKVLVGCIDWRTSTINDLNIFYFHWSHTAEGSGGQVFVTHLMRSVMNNCDRNRKSEEIDCQCVPIDKNGRSVLEVPDAIFESLPDDLGAVQEDKDSSKSEIDNAAAEISRAAEDRRTQTSHGTLPGALNQGQVDPREDDSLHAVP